MGRRFLGVMLLAGVIASGWLLYIGVSVMATLSIVTSLGYQAGALPWDIVRNCRAKNVTKVSYGLAFLGAASYVTSTFRAILQPDLVDVIRQWCGMVGTLIISGQIIYYDRVRLSTHPPFVIRRAFTNEENEMEDGAVVHMTSPSCHPCQQDSDHVMQWTQRCPACGGNVHFMDVEPHNSRKSVHIYTGKCDGCGKNHTYTRVSHDPYVKGSTFWVKEEAEGNWRQVSHEEYVAIIGDDPAYAANGVYGLVAAPGKSPRDVKPGDGMIGMVLIMSYTLNPP